MIAFHGDSSNVDTCPDPSSSLAKGLVPTSLYPVHKKTSAYAASFVDHTHKDNYVTTIQVMLPNMVQ